MFVGYFILAWVFYILHIVLCLTEACPSYSEGFKGEDDMVTAGCVFGIGAFMAAVWPLLLSLAILAFVWDILCSFCSWAVSKSKISSEATEEPEPTPQAPPQTPTEPEANQDISEIIEVVNYSIREIDI